MTETFRNLRIWLCFAVLGVVAMMLLTGNIAFARKGPTCVEAHAAGEPGFAALGGKGGGTGPACVRVRIG